MRNWQLGILFTAAFILGLLSCSPSKEKEKEDSTEESIIKESSTTNLHEPDNASELTWSTVKVEELPVEGHYPQFSMSGRGVVYSTENYKGLWLFDFESKTTRQLTDREGAGFKPVILEDKIVYEVRARLKYLEEVDINTGTITKIQDNEARFRPFEYVTYKKVVAGEEDIWVRTSADLFSIEVMNYDSIRSFAPVGKNNYVNPSLSPDKSFILFEVIGKGGYISDLKGNIIYELGDMDKPSWIGNNHVLYALSKDDGEQIISSEVYVLNIKTEEKFNLSDDIELQVENPRGDRMGTKVVANTPGGKLLMISKSN